MKLPVGATWLVLPYISPSTKKRFPDEVASGAITPSGLEARTTPTGNTANMWDTHLDGMRRHYLDIPPETVIITGETWKDSDTLLYPHAEWVEVIFPTQCYVNRIHFNSGSDRVTRIG